jgi:hypothetical protein
MEKLGVYTLFHLEIQLSKEYDSSTKKTASITAV